MSVWDFVELLYILAFKKKTLKEKLSNAMSTKSSNETITAIACDNADEIFLSVACIPDERANIKILSSRTFY